MNLHVTDFLFDSSQRQCKLKVRFTVNLTLNSQQSTDWLYYQLWLLRFSLFAGHWGFWNRNWFCPEGAEKDTDPELRPLISDLIRNLIRVGSNSACHVTLVNTGSYNTNRISRAAYFSWQLHLFVIARQIPVARAYSRHLIIILYRIISVCLCNRKTPLIYQETYHSPMMEISSLQHKPVIIRQAMRNHLLLLYHVVVSRYVDC